ncbi:MAG: hypothetical protein JJ913_01225 [Rhizobiaceae bacterium]|nr:hypothetical protein [Rhizobiaceae bacterium]
MTAFASLSRLCAVLGFLATAGCQSASIEDVVPGARNTGTYPNINVAPQAETEQLTDEEAASQLVNLQSRRDAQNAAPASQATEVERLRRLRQTHAEETIEQIEN